jgi:TRAP-type mannitol/chloroaromatic compound transport system permease small subunit
MRKYLDLIDGVNGWLGSAMRWFVVIAFLLTTLEVTQRYVFGHPTMWGYETPIHFGAAMYCLSWGYVHKLHGHVRVDVLYGHLSQRARAIIDVACFVVLFVPAIGFLAYTSGQWMVDGWRILERSVLTYWYPPIYPLRTAIFAGVFLFLLQGVAQFMRDVYLLVRGEPYD